MLCFALPARFTWVGLAPFGLAWLQWLARRRGPEAFAGGLSSLPLKQGRPPTATTWNAAPTRQTQGGCQSNDAVAPDVGYLAKHPFQVGRRRPLPLRRAFRRPPALCAAARAAARGGGSCHSASRFARLLLPCVIVHTATRIRTGRLRIRDPLPDRNRNTARENPAPNAGLLGRRVRPLAGPLAEGRLPGLQAEVSFGTRVYKGRGRPPSGGFSCRTPNNRAYARPRARPTTPTLDCEPWSPLSPIPDPSTLKPQTLNPQPLEPPSPDPAIP